HLDPLVEEDPNPALLQIGTEPLREALIRLHMLVADEDLAQPLRLPRSCRSLQLLKLCRKSLQLLGKEGKRLGGPCAAAPGWHGLAPARRPALPVACERVSFRTWGVSRSGN